MAKFNKILKIIKKSSILNYLNTFLNDLQAVPRYDDECMSKKPRVMPKDMF